MTEKGIGFARKIKLNVFRSFIKNETLIHELRYLFWECTLKCNLKCLHCGSDCTSETHIPDMPASVFLGQMQKLAAKTDPRKIMIVITGGEPTLRRDLESIGFRLRELGYRWGIVTNGMAYSETRHKSLMSAGMGALTLSFDGLQENHNWLRNNPSSFKNALEALDHIAESPRLNYDVVTCVNQRNIRELENILELLTVKGVKAWRLFTIAPKGRAANHTELQLTATEYTYLMDFIVTHRKNKMMKIQYSCESFTGRYEGTVRDGLFFCRAGIHIGSILCDGSVSACPNLDRGFIQGNIYKNDFWNIWNDCFGVMRNRDWTKTGMCSGCTMYTWCRGSGLHLWDAEEKQLRHCHARHII